jgi:chromosome segregation ATPase
VLGNALQSSSGKKKIKINENAWDAFAKEFATEQQQNKEENAMWLQMKANDNKRKMQALYPKVERRLSMIRKLKDDMKDTVQRMQSIAKESQHVQNKIKECHKTIRNKITKSKIKSLENEMRRDGIPFKPFEYTIHERVQLKLKNNHTTTVSNIPEYQQAANLLRNTSATTLKTLQNKYNKCPECLKKMTQKYDALKQQRQQMEKTLKTLENTYQKCSRNMDRVQESINLTVMNYQSQLNGQLNHMKWAGYNTNTSLQLNNGSVYSYNSNESESRIRI